MYGPMQLYVRVPNWNTAFYVFHFDGNEWMMYRVEGGRSVLIDDAVFYSAPTAESESALLCYAPSQRHAAWHLFPDPDRGRVCELESRLATLSYRSLPAEVQMACKQIAGMP